MQLYKRWGFALAWIGWLMAAPNALAASEEAGALSLSALIEEAVNANPEIEAARQRWEAAKTEISPAKSLEDPQFRILFSEMPSALNIGRADVTEYGIGQRFPFPGKRALQEQMAAYAAEAAERNYAAAILNLTARVKTAYYQLFRIQKEVALHLEHQALLMEFVQTADRKYALGQASQQDILKAQVESSRLHDTLLVLEQEKLATETEINTLLGWPADTTLGRVEMPAYHPFLWTLEDLTKKALTARPDLTAARLKVEQSERGLALAKKNRLPDFEMEIMYSDAPAGLDQWAMMGKINLPWIFKGPHSAHVHQAAAKTAEARAQQQVLYNQILFELRNLFTHVKTAEKRILLYQNEVLPRAEQMLASTRISYRAGKVDFLSLIDSERTLRELQMEFFGALALFWQSIAELTRAVGGEITF